MHNIIIKERQLEKDFSCKAHYFPELDDGYVNGNSCDKKADFRRIDSSDELTNLTKNGKHRYYNRKKDIDCIKKEAYDKGYLEGIKSGKKEIEPLLSKLLNAMNELESLKNQVYQMAEKEAVDLSLAIARKIVGIEISVNKNVIIKTVKEALKKVEGHDNIQIKLNPSELQIIDENKCEFEESTSCLEKIIFTPEESINPGGCIVETNIGDIDARIEKQLKIVEDAFKANM